MVFSGESAESAPLSIRVKCYLNIISLIRGERLKLLARLLWTCQRIIVHAKQDSSNILSIIIYNTTREENDEQIN